MLTSSSSITMNDSKPSLSPCPFCGRIPSVVRRDVEPQGDSWYGSRMELFVLCDCGCCLFDADFHEGFGSEVDAISAWNKRYKL